MPFQTLPQSLSGDDTLHAFSNVVPTRAERVASSSRDSSKQQMNKSGRGDQKCSSLLLFCHSFSCTEAQGSGTGAVLAALSLREAPLLTSLRTRRQVCRRLAEGLALRILRCLVRLRSDGQQETDRDKFHSELWTVCSFATQL